MSNLDSSKIILSICKPGEYFGKEAQEKINLIAESVHAEIIKACAHYSKMDLINTFYDFFDKVCYISIDGTSWIKDEEPMLKALLKAPSTGRYLLETSIGYGGNQENKELSQEVKQEFLSAGYTFVSCCNVSNYFFYGNYRGGLRINADGTIEELITDQAQKVMDDYFEKMRIRKQAVINLSTAPNKGKREDYFYDLAKNYDVIFKKKYGVNLSSIITLVIAMYRLRKERFGLVTISRKDLLKKLQREQKQDFDEALKLFEITKDCLMKDWKYFKLYRVPVSVVRKPIINLSGKIGGGGMVVFGGYAMLHSLAFLFNDIEAGNIELELDADAIQEKRGRDFEKNLIPELSGFGLNVIHMGHTSKEVGDIDAVAFNPRNNVLMVMEAKSPRINIDVSKINKQVENAQEWYKQLKKKVDWVKDNLDLVKERLKIEKGRIVHIEGMIVTEVPWFFETNPVFKMFTLEELKLLLKNDATF